MISTSKIYIKEQTIIKKINSCHSSEEVYRYLILQGRLLLTKPRWTNTSYQFLPSCQTNTYFALSLQQDSLLLDGYSDSLLVSGLLQQVIDLYHNCLISELITFKPSWLQDTCLDTYLTSYRYNGINGLERLIIASVDSLRR